MNVLVLTSLEQTLVTATFVAAATIYLGYTGWRYAAGFRARTTGVGANGRCGGCSGCGATAGAGSQRRVR
jgi:hypothetical protein